MDGGVSTLRYLHLDVYAATRGGGNHLGVVLGADAWDTAEMQRFAAWSDLVETTFLLAPTQPDASYRVRIFMPNREVPFAGHPSVGSAHAALACGLVRPVDGLLRQECAVGVLPIRVEGHGAQRRLLLHNPAAKVLATGSDAHPALAAAMDGIKPGVLPSALVAGGRRWWLAEVADEAMLRGWQPAWKAIQTLAKATDSFGLCVFARSTQPEYQLVVRAFAAYHGVTEDPASGAANGLIAAYIRHAEPTGPLAQGYVVSQGREVGHDAAMVVRIADDGIWVGGRTHTIIDGELEWDAPAAAAAGEVAPPPRARQA
jgi:PhzF family phenazine biosynthesis protein